MTFREHKERPFSSLWAHFQAVEAGSWQAQGCAAQVPPPETRLLLAYGSRSEQQIHPSCWTVWFVPGLTVKHHSADEYLELPCVHSVLANSPVPPVPRGLVEKGCYGSMLRTSHTSTASPGWHWTLAPFLPGGIQIQAMRTEKHLCSMWTGSGSPLSPGLGRKKVL